MHVLFSVPELGIPRPTSCVITPAHSPAPVRYVLHHIQPHEAGGPTVAENLIGVDDNCHYSIHWLMWILACQALGRPVTPDMLGMLARPPRRAQLTYAQQGFAACQAAGTVAKIPDEGGPATSAG